MRLGLVRRLEMVISDYQTSSSGHNSVVGMSRGGAFPLDGRNNAVNNNASSNAQLQMVLRTARQVLREVRSGILLSTSGKQEMRPQ